MALKTVVEEGSLRSAIEQGLVGPYTHWNLLELMGGKGIWSTFQNQLLVLEWCSHSAAKQCLHILVLGSPEELSFFSTLATRCSSSGGERVDCLPYIEKHDLLSGGVPSFDDCM